MPPGIVFDAAALKIKVTSMTVGSKCTNGYSGIPLILWYLWLGTGEFRLSFRTSGWVQENSAYPLVPLAGYRGILVVYW